MSHQLEHLLESVFGLRQFRPHQREVVEDVLQGHDVLCVMPTGAGKSLCFQLPAVALRGLTLIVSPLISLMADQIAHLRSRKIPALLLNSSQTMEEQRAVIKTVANGFDGLLYVAPERFASRSFQWLMPRIKPKLFVIDEAHCVSFWGHDFRPEYMKLAAVRKELGNPVTIALTATATRQVQKDIVKMLGMESPKIHVTGFDRPNLTYACRKFEKDREKDPAMLRFLETQKGSGIIYCSTRRAVEEITALLEEKFKGRRILAYHAGMSQDERRKSQVRFMDAENSIVVATNAFGMGINKADTRFVLHYNLPGSLEAYYQEAGRAGRDGYPAHCLLYVSGADLRTQRFFIQQIGDNNQNLSEPDIERLRRHSGMKLELMNDYAMERRCRRKQILGYFGEDDISITDCHCDMCEFQTAPHRYSPSVPVKLSNEQAKTVLRRVMGEPSETEYERSQPRTRRVVGARPATTEMRGATAMTSSPEFKRGEAFGTAASPARSPERVRASKSVAARKTVMNSELDEASRPLYERLRTWRLEYARKNGWPAFCVLNDATLAEIARSRPQTIKELLAIPGFGPKKAEKFGEPLLKQLAER